jgi:hypothetical protein
MSGDPSRTKGRVPKPPEQPGAMPQTPVTEIQPIQQKTALAPIGAGAGRRPTQARPPNPDVPSPNAQRHRPEPRQQILQFLPAPQHPPAHCQNLPTAGGERSYGQHQPGSMMQSIHNLPPGNYSGQGSPFGASITSEVQACAAHNHWPHAAKKHTWPAFRLAMLMIA